MKMRLTKRCNFEVIDGKNGESYVLPFKKNLIIDAIIINKGEETDEYFDLRLTTGQEIIGVQKSNFEIIEYNPSIVKMHNHYVFMGQDGQMKDNAVVIGYNITISAYDQKSATEKAKEVGAKLGIVLEQTYPRIK